MWITEQLGQKNSQAVATTANVTKTNKNTVCTSGSEKHKDVPVFLPYGIESVPPSNSTVLLLNADNGATCTGCLCNIPSVSEGEIRLFSQGGASLILKNNGDIVLNGVRITKEGNIIKVGELRGYIN